MPYIADKEVRKELDDVVRKHSTLWFTKGNLNYLICRIWKFITASNGVSYDEARKMIGELECAKMEIYRRWVAPYEDVKKEENSDVGE
jgi:hypothetical protein